MNFQLLAIFGAGVMTFATPCVLPLIPIYLSALIGADIRHLESRSRGRLFFRALFFSLGFLAVFTLLGLTATSLGAVLLSNKGFLQLAGALLVAIFSLKFLGLLHIPLLDRIAKADDRNFRTRFEWLNATVMGAVFAAGWSPCVGPVLGAVLTYTASAASHPLEGALYLFIYGLGFAVPLLLTAVFAEKGASFLRKINPYLPRIERAIGIALLLVAISMGVDAARSLSFRDDIATLPLLTIDAHGESSPTMVEFVSSGCPVCKRMKPVVDGLVSQCDERGVRIKTVDISEGSNRAYAEVFRISGVPTFIFLQENGEESARLIGEHSETELKQALSALRKKPCPGVAVPTNPQTGEFLFSYPEEKDTKPEACGADKKISETSQEDNDALCSSTKSL